MCSYLANGMKTKQQAPLVVKTANKKIVEPNFLTRTNNFYHMKAGNSIEVWFNKWFNQVFQLLFFMNNVKVVRVCFINIWFKNVLFQVGFSLGKDI